jgi:hypothetical protein
MCEPSPWGYNDALRIVCDFTEGLTSESAEYERGQLELLGDLFPAEGVELGDRIEQIARDIKAMAETDRETDHKREAKEHHHG